MPMRTSTLVQILLTPTLLLGALWWVAQGSATTDNNQATTTPARSFGLSDSAADQAPVPIVLSVATSSALGVHLVATNRMTLYRYAKDPIGASVCLDDCAGIWLPYVVTDPDLPLLPGPGVHGTLSVITREDGTRQLTYKGSPLYYYRNDALPGDTTGQGVASVWYVAVP